MKKQKVSFLIIFSLIILSVSGCTKYKNVSETTVIPYKTIENQDASLLKGQTRVIQPGVKGIRTVTYKETYKGDKKVGRKKIKAETISKPSDEVVNVGTMESWTLTANATTYAFEIELKKVSRQQEYVGKNEKLYDAIVINGTIKNIGKKPATIGKETDLALIDPAIKGGIAFLTASPAATVKPGQTTELTWAGSVNDNALEGKNAALKDISLIKIAVRGNVGPKNSIRGEIHTLEGFSSI